MYSQSTYHSCGICIIDNVDHKWLQGDNILSTLPCGTWVKITNSGLYKNDLVLVVESPRQGDVMTLAVIPCFNQNERKWKWKSTRPNPVLLNTESLDHLPFKDNFHRLGSWKFHPSSLEFLLALAVHTLKLENNPSEEWLRLFEQSVSLYSRGKPHDIDLFLLDAVKLAYHWKVQETWHVRDWWYANKWSLLWLSVFNWQPTTNYSYDLFAR